MKSIFLRARRCAVACAAFALIACTAAHAYDVSDSIVVHGYGYQDFISVDKNTYLGADDHGSWDNNFLGLVVAADINEKSKLWAQLESTTNDGTRFTWFFVDYQFSDNLRGHVGRVKFPIGLYNETIDAKQLQVTQLEPSIYQVATDMVHDAYHGVGLDYEQYLGDNHLLWQVYGGNAYDLDPPEDSRDRAVLGGRITYSTPIDGLRFMLSGYRTRVEELATREMTYEDRTLASVDFTRGSLDLKAEYARHSFFGVDSHAYYVQAGYTLGKWKPYARYDVAILDDARRSDPAFYQKTVVAGIEYAIATNVAFRLENHFNRGFGLPVASGEIAASDGRQNWNLIVAGINFAF